MQNHPLHPTVYSLSAAYSYDQAVILLCVICSNLIIIEHSVEFVETNLIEKNKMLYNFEIFDFIIGHTILSLFYKYQQDKTNAAMFLNL